MICGMFKNEETDEKDPLGNVKVITLQCREELTEEHEHNWQPLELKGDEDG